tara:strand:- start:1112 stop:1366 length:255 start_codon:yes stop_codon:yes gene_type:complete
MSKIKEKLLNDDSFLEDAINDHLDDEYYYDKSKQVTMEEIMQNHDDWWNSLTDKQKQKIADEHKSAEDYFTDNDLHGPNKQYGV